MKMGKIVVCLTFVCIVAVVAVSDIRGEDCQERMLKKAESRLRAIYERREFRARRFRADWLPDSSGYTVMEQVPGSNERVPVRYDVTDGKRTVLDSPRKDRGGRSGNISPDGRRMLYYDQGNLYVRDLRSDRTIQLTKSPPASRQRGFKQPRCLEPRWKADRLRAIGQFPGKTEAGPRTGRPELSGSKRSPLCQGGRDHTCVAGRRCRCPGKPDAMAVHSRTRGGFLSGTGRLGRKFP